MATRYPPGSRFLPTDLGLLKHLKKKVKGDYSGFIKTMNMYEDAPWRLDHDMNPLYPKNEWYYFVAPKIRGKQTVSRIVPSKGESLGGTWKVVGKKEEITNKDNKLKGYKRGGVFNKKNVEGNSKNEWLMDEYTLVRKGAEFYELVLCHIRLINSSVRFRPVPAAHRVVENNNNNNVVLPNQEQLEAGFAMLENDMMVLDNGGDDVNQHQQQEEQEYALIPFQRNDNQGQYLLEAIVFPNQHQQQEPEDSLIPFPSNDNQEEYLLEDINAFGGAENDMIDYDLFMKTMNEGNPNNNQEQFPSSDTLLVPTHDHQVDNNTFLPNQEAGFVNQSMVAKEQGHVKQEQEDTPSLPLGPLLSNNDQGLSLDDYGFDDDSITLNLDEESLTEQQEMELFIASLNLSF